MSSFPACKAPSDMPCSSCHLRGVALKPWPFSQDSLGGYAWLCEKCFVRDLEAMYGKGCPTTELDAALVSHNELRESLKKVQTGKLMSIPMPKSDGGIAFQDGPGVSVTEVWNGYIIRWSAKTVEELLELRARYKDKSSKPLSVGVDVGSGADKSYEVKEATNVS